jgi:hypothetical protein
MTEAAPGPSGPPDRGDDLPTPEDRRWALLAAELPFEQLRHARTQAEGWRNGLATAITAVGAVSLIRGRDELAALPPGWRVAAVATFLLAFVALTAGFLLMVTAAHGRPGVLIDADGESLREYVATEAPRVTRLVRGAGYLAACGICLMVAAAAVTWLAPTADATAPEVTVLLDSGQACGRLVGIDAGHLILLEADSASDATLSIPVSAVERLVMVPSC